MNLFRTLILAVSCAAGTLVSAQLIDGRAYMIGDYIEIGIDSAGFEGTEDLPGSNSRGPAYIVQNFGFVANPQMDGWVNYNGDFYTPGTPENGFGFEIGGTNYGNNGTGGGGFGSEVLWEIPGSIVDYTETADSITVTWQGTVAGVDVGIIYELQKDQIYYTTKILMENTTATAMGPVYYYRNIDPDHNQLIGGGFVTENTILQQASSVPGDDTAMVFATQAAPWLSWYGLAAVGENWRASMGGFINRDASDLWDGISPYVLDEDSVWTADIAISMAYKVDTLPTGKAAPIQFSFDSWFDTIAYPPSDPGTGMGIYDEEETSFHIYPNPSDDEFTLVAEGSYYYFVSDASGKMMVAEQSEGVTRVDVSDYPAGTYFVKVRQNGRFKTRQIVVK